MFLSSVCYCQVYITVRGMLLSVICYYKVYISVMRVLLSNVCYCHVYVTARCMLLSYISYCQVYANVNCVKCMLLSGVCYYSMHVTVKCCVWNPTCAQKLLKSSAGKLFNVETWIKENIFSSYFLLLVPIILLFFRYPSYRTRNYLAMVHHNINLDRSYATKKK